MAPDKEDISFEKIVGCSGSAMLEVKNFAGKTVQTWLAFISENGKEASNSFYTGELLVK